MATLPQRIVLTGVSRGLGEPGRRIDRAWDMWLRLRRSAEAIEERSAAVAAPHRFAWSTWPTTARSPIGPSECWPPAFPICCSTTRRSSIATRRCGKSRRDEISDVVDVNIKGVVNVDSAFRAGHDRPARGVIVNFSSGWGRSTAPEVAPYCATEMGRRRAHPGAGSGTAAPAWRPCRSTRASSIPPCSAAASAQGGEIYRRPRPGPAGRSLSLRLGRQRMAGSVSIRAFEELKGLERDGPGAAFADESSVRVTGAKTELRRPFFHTD